MKLDTDQINYLNICLMILSCLAAFIVPFELFLFSYAVLGPLHYLTEISWLHDRNYFVEKERDKRVRLAWLALVFVTLLVISYRMYSQNVLQQNFPLAWEIAMLFLVFVTACFLMFVKRRATAVVLIALTLVALVFFSDSKFAFLATLFLLTIIHVFVFTAAFILYGALRGKSRSGILSLVVFVVCVVSFFVYTPREIWTSAGEYIRNNYVSFARLNAELIKLFNLGAGNSPAEIYDSKAGLIVMRFIAFAYTYHYLNWFSKTSIIKWHEISKPRAVGIIGLWLAALGVYAYDYRIGMLTLYLLSVLHVMLEFPLNHQTFAGIGKELRSLYSK